MATQDSRTTRRRLLRGLIAGSGAALLSACLPGDSSDEPASEQVPEPTGPAAVHTVGPESTGSSQDAPDVPLEAKIAEMTLLGFIGTTMDDIDSVGEAMRTGRTGNLVLFDRNVVSPAQLNQLTSDAIALTASPPLISIDQEGGYVARLRPDKGFPESVSHLYLGYRDTGVTYDYAARMAAAMHAAGINLNLAPVVDVNINPSNPAIGFHERSFSADPEAVADHALAFIRAHHDNGVLCTLKHFAGHGSSTADSHLGLTDVTLTWTRDELIPFQRVIDAGEADAVMTAHIVNDQLDPQHPGTLSHATITGLLREQMGYDGVVITDDMQMGAIEQYFGFQHAIELAIQAGADVIAVANTMVYDPDLPFATFNAILAAVHSGAITEARIDESYRRIRRLKARLG